MGVTTTRLPSRWNNGPPISASSFLMAAVRAGWETPHSCAAREKLPCELMAMK
jgi:hypothetical protein